MDETNQREEKSLGKNTLDLVKIVMGRKLSRKQLDKAKIGKEETENSVIHPNYFEGNFDNLFLMPDGQIKRKIRRYNLATTNDASYGPQIKHTNYYVTSGEDAVYTPEGLIIERSTFTCEPFSLSTGSKKIRYNPPGRIMGATEKAHMSITP